MNPPALEVSSTVAVGKDGDLAMQVSYAIASGTIHSASIPRMLQVSLENEQLTSLKSHLRESRWRPLPVEEERSKSSPKLPCRTKTQPMERRGVPSSIEIPIHKLPLMLTRQLPHPPRRYNRRTKKASSSFSTMNRGDVVVVETVEADEAEVGDFSAAADDDEIRTCESEIDGHSTIISYYE